MKPNAKSQLSADLSGIFTSQSAGPSIFKKINQYRDEGTHADEWLILFRILLPISAAFTLAFGAALHYSIVLPYTGPVLAGIFAFAFTLFIELSKLIAGKWVFRGLFFHLYKQGAASLLVLLSGAFIALGAFWWSYYNSTKGVEYITQHIGHQVVERPLAANQTADVDARLTAAEKTKRDALGIKWKGTTTVGGQRIAEKQAAVQIEQEKQRTILLQQQVSEQIRIDEHRGTFINKVSTLLSLLGGKMEWFQLFLLIGMVACEKALWDRLSTKSASAKDTYSPTPPSGVKVVDLEPEPTHFFNRVKESGQVTPSINGLPENRNTDVLQNQQYTNVDWDSSVKHYIQQFSMECANLKNGNGQPATVARRLHGTLDTCFALIRRKGFSPSQDILTKLNTSARKAFDQLDDIDKTYPQQRQFLLILDRVGDTAAQ